MSDVVSLNTDTNYSHETGSTGHTENTSWTNYPLSIVPAHQLEANRRHVQTAIPELPSHKFQYSVWHDLGAVDVKGNELKAPRVRKGPNERYDIFDNLRDEENQLIHHAKRGSEQTRHQTQTENWENATFASFCYQELSDRYQRNNLMRILHRLGRVEELHLVDNGITDFGFLSFPCCRRLNLNNNYISSFKNLPSVPNLVFLSLENNHIATLSGFSKFSSSPLEELYLKGNPVTFDINYRQSVFQVLPRLQILDGIPKLPSDSDPVDPDYDSHSSSRCTVS